MPGKNKISSGISVSAPPDTKLTILGSGACEPSLERSACTALVETGSQKLLLDIGAGTLRRLLENHTRMEDISHILISHFHPDHTGELASFLFASKYSSLGPRKIPLTLIGGPGTQDFFHRLGTVYPHWIDLGPDLFQLVELSDPATDGREYDHLKIKFARVAHNDESIAFRIEDRAGKTVVYSGDTDYCEPLVDIAANADVFICESSFPDEVKIPGHLTPSLAGKIATAADVRHLVLTHFYPQCNMAHVETQCRNTYKGPLTLARDLMEIRI